MENILITGVSTGIGYDLSKRFLEGGCRVIGSVRNQKDASRLTAEFGEHFHAIIMDVTDVGSVTKSVETTKSIIGEGGLDCLINNAGIAVGGPIVYIDMEDFRRQMEVNFFGAISVTKAYFPLLGAVPNYQYSPGKILNISSVSGQISYPFLGPYCASKAALEAFGDSLRREMLLYGIDVINIEPGPVRTPIWTKSTGFPEHMLNSDFGPALKRFYKATRKSEEKGLEPEDLADRIYRIYKKKNPGVRYVFVNRKISNFIIPRYLITPRLFDRFVKKIFFPD